MMDAFAPAAAGPQQEHRMALDFSMAKLKHSSWKFKLRDFLDGKPGLTAAQASNHHECDLGKWPYSEGRAKYGKLPEMVALEKEHEVLHTTVKTIMDLKAAGKVKEAEAEYLKVAPLSTKILDLLTAIESRVARMAA